MCGAGGREEGGGGGKKISFPFEQTLTHWLTPPCTMKIEVAKKNLIISTVCTDDGALLPCHTNPPVPLNSDSSGD